MIIWELELLIHFSIIYNYSLSIFFDAGEDKYVVLVSGLCIGSNTFNPLQFQLFVDHITGHLGEVKVCNISNF